MVVFVLYIIIFPAICVQNVVMAEENIKLLLLFDVLFMIDRFLDLFQGYYNPNGFLEHRVLEVVRTNINYRFFLEIFITIAPIVLMD
jgi:hypothetical protein